MAPPRISVVIPLYNKEQHILRAVNSVVHQTIRDFELIVVDDGSTDGGPGIVSSMSDQRIKLITQSNAGVSAARNKGVENATASLIGFLDADDEWESTFLETILRLQRSYPDAGLYATAYREILPDGRKSFPIYKGIPGDGWEGPIPSYFRSALGPPPVWSSAVAIPKKVFLEVGGFPLGIQFAEDKEVWERVALRYFICFSSHIGSTYYLDATNRSCKQIGANKWERPFINMARAALEQNQVMPQIRSDLQEYLDWLLIIQAKRNILLYGDPCEGRRLLLKAKPSRYKSKIQKFTLFLSTYIQKEIVLMLYGLYGKTRSYEKRK